MLLRVGSEAGVVDSACGNQARRPVSLTPRHTGYIEGDEVSSGGGWWQFLSHVWMSLHATGLCCKVANLCYVDFTTIFKGTN